MLIYSDKKHFNKNILSEDEEKEGEDEEGGREEEEEDKEYNEIPHIYSEVSVVENLQH
jgi:hypothetical protein